MKKKLIGAWSIVPVLFAVPAYADVAKGLEYLESNDVPAAAKEFSDAYESGDGDGAFYLGRMSELGIGLKPDLSMPSHYIKLA